MEQLTKEYWEERYAEGNTGWDIGYVSTPLKTYFDQLEDKGIKLLIPGGGRSYEAEYLHRNGFHDVHVVDHSDRPFTDLLRRYPAFPQENLHQGDFFEHQGQYDRIIEQTFFCALAPGSRTRYAQHMHQLLKPGGKLVGVLFDDPLFPEHPPFGGNAEEYRRIFHPVFPLASFERCYNSIPPRAGRELWMIAPKTEAVSGW